MAHVAEHFGYAYRRQIEDRVGIALPPPDMEMSEVEEVAMSRFVAQASQQLLQIHTAQAQQQQAEQMAQDPLVQMQQQELQIKQAEVQRKAQKDAADTQIQQERVAIERDRIQAQLVKDGLDIAEKSRAERRG
jgi:hypothetical protein